MPSTATITSTDFTVFSAGTKAKSAEMNGNFDIWRGHNLPVNADTSSSSDAAHDLGAADHRWKNAYHVKSQIGRNASGISIEEETANTTSAATLLIKVNSATVAKFGNDGYFFHTALTSDYSITTQDCHGYKVFTNDGASTSTTFNLPSVAAGYRVYIANVEAKTITVSAFTSDTINTADTSGGATIQLSSKGESIELFGMNAVEWIGMQ